MIKKLKQKWFWSKNSEQGPPDLEEMIKRFFGKKNKTDNNDNESIYSKNANKKQSTFNKPPIAKIVTIIVALLIVAWVGFGFYVVQPAEQAIVLRLGKFSKLVEPGLHWHPLGIDKVYKENVQELKTISLKRDMLTSEENIVHISFTVQYRIADLEKYLFANTNPTLLLQQALESAVRQVVGENKLEQILTTNRAVITQQVRKEMEALLEKYNSGIYVSEVIMQPAQAPDAVKSAFDDVIKAREDREREQNEAEAYANRVVPVAQGNAQRILDQANAYKQKIVLEAQGEVAQFEQLLPIYKQSPDIVMNQMYFNTISNVLQHNKIFLIDSDGAKNIFYGLSDTQKQALLSNTQGGN
ncbi:FtsH protease activity modulator HflK [Francisella tularensis]|uniref:FtsH protease activity modulator HflK n=1 Tax=Francisella tularensis TaxID=263 RepID=UPI00197DAB6E|nr:FtsH protease activity modulator HflK [Francisella tularensis]MBN3663243.1 FtsH protease activity modulator HflK [Francisella tularensis subsp. holarctica]MBN3666414.1 FtsH protease activity modulator HflK [Francisella tularensis subsp. holarctica]MBN3667972.1 FtsH protease activity modulator HflK [Francisella tularensis subsp. holarctica]MBN3706187.1 FtsH protease activity modulator HflK [Francisella tularensis subsp. holarctica]MBN3709370.1 FtsH protease activity modulator HflK [Francisel